MRINTTVSVNPHHRPAWTLIWVPTHTPTANANTTTPTTSTRTDIYWTSNLINNVSSKQTNKRTNEGKTITLSLSLSLIHTLYSLSFLLLISLTLKLSHSCFETNFYRHPPFVISPALKRPLLCHNHFSFSDPKTQTHTHPLATQHKTGKMSLWNSVITGLNWYFCFICFNKAQFSFRTL